MRLTEEGHTAHRGTHHAWLAHHHAWLHHRLHVLGHRGRGGCRCLDRRGLEGFDTLLGVVQRLAVLGDVEALVLRRFGHPETTWENGTKDAEDQSGTGGRVQRYDEDASNLPAELFPIAVECAGRAANFTCITIQLLRGIAGILASHGSDVGVGEEASQDTTDDATDTMDPEGVQRIVDAHHVLELDASIAAHAAEEAHDESAGLVNVASSGSDDDKTGDGARHDTQHGRLALDHPLEKHPGEASGRGRNVGDQHGHRSRAACSNRGTSVEAEPADPEEGGAKEGEEHVVRGQLGAGRPGAALADDDGRNEARHARRNMHHVAAGKVENSPLAHEAASPLPVGNGAVDEEVPEEDEDQERGELHALGDGAGDDSAGDNGEGHLEHHEERLREGPRSRARHDGLARLRVAKQPDLVAAADVVAVVVLTATGEGEGVANSEPEDGDKAGDGKRLHHGREHVLRARETTIEQRQAGDGHHQHQARRGEDPRSVAGVHCATEERVAAVGRLPPDACAAPHHERHSPTPAWGRLGREEHARTTRSCGPPCNAPGRAEGQRACAHEAQGVRTHRHERRARAQTRASERRGLRGLKRSNSRNRRIQGRLRRHDACAGSAEMCPAWTSFYLVVKSPLKTEGDQSFCIKW